MRYKSFKTRYNKRGYDLLLEAITVQAVQDYRRLHCKHETGVISPYDKYIYETACNFLFDVIPAITSMDADAVKRGLELQRPDEKNLKPRADRR